MKVRTGVDILEIPRIQGALDRHGERFLERVFTPAEITQCKGRADRLAVLFAAKEAISKALGTGIGPVSWCEMEILHLPSGEPTVVLHGRARQLAERMGLTSWSVSLSHSRDNAVAVVVAAGE